jgi:hypothetical protein
MFTQTALVILLDMYAAATAAVCPLCCRCFTESALKAKPHTATPDTKLTPKPATPRPYGQEAANVADKKRPATTAPPVIKPAESATAPKPADASRNLLQWGGWGGSGSMSQAQAQAQAQSGSWGGMGGSGSQGKSLTVTVTVISTLGCMCMVEPCRSHSVRC